MNNTPFKLPITNEERRRNMLGPGGVPCQVTERWLQFSDKYSKDLDLVYVNVMTKGNDGDSKKVCELCIRTKDMFEALKWVQSHSSK